MKREDSHTLLKRCRKQNERLQKALEINRLIAGEFQLGPLLRQIMEITQSIMDAEGCSLFLIDKETGDLIFHTTTGGQEAQMKDICRLSMGCGIAGWCAEHRSALRLNDVYADPRFADEYDRLTGFKTRNMICVPMIARGELIGVSQVINHRHGDFSQSDEQLMESLVPMEAIAIDNARTHQHLLDKQIIKHDLELAKSIQDALLPSAMPAVDGYAASTYISSAFEVGGDFFDAVILPDRRIAYVLGDISGKGVSAAMIMSGVLHTLRSELNQGGSAGDMLSRYNTSLCQTASNGMFASMALMILDPETGLLQSANAGHPPAIHMHKQRIWQPNEASGPPLGIISDMHYDCETVALEQGEMTLLYSDGLTDARNEQQQMLGMGRMLAWMQDAPPAASACIDYLTERIKTFVGNATQTDDIALLALVRNPQSKEPIAQLVSGDQLPHAGPF